jgi:hypothetical protein
LTPKGGAGGSIWLGSDENWEEERGEGKYIKEERGLTEKLDS